MTDEDHHEGRERVERASASEGAPGGTDYTAASIQVLEGLEAVRRRPGMYIGSTDERGLHHLVWEVVDNSIDEAMAGHATTIHVTIKADGTVIVRDDGRGVPVGKHSTGKDALEVVHTVLHAGGKFGGGGYKVSGGLHGVGVSVVNALSVVDARRNPLETAASGRRNTRAASRSARSRRKGRRGRAGARSRASAPTRRCSRRSSTRSRRSASACASPPTSPRASGSRLIDERVDRERSFYFEGGLQSFVRHLNRNKEALHSRPIYVERKEGSTAVEVALQYNDTYTENVLAFANNINTPDGGSHVTGFRAALTSSLNDWARRAGVLKDNDTQPVRRRRSRGPDGRHQREADRPAVRGPDQGETRATPRSRARSRRPSRTASASTSTRTRPTVAASSRSASRPPAPARRPARRATS